MRVDLQSAYVIHTREYRDSSLLVDFLTADYGRVSCVAKGVRAANKTAKQKRSSLQSFLPLLISWGGNTELKNLYHIEARPHHLSLQGQRLFSAMYINELLSRLLHSEEDSSEIFELYQQVLVDLSGAEPVDIVLRRFELSLIAYLGYGINLESVAETGEPVLADKNYQYIPEFGLSLTVSSTAAYTSFLGEDLLSISKGDFNLSARRAAKTLCRAVLAHYLGAKPLKSRELFG